MPRTMQTARRSADGPPARGTRKRSAPSSARTTTFNIGSTVSIQKSSPEFNGQVGTIKSKPNDTYTVELLSNKKLVSARLINMKLVDGNDVALLLESKDKEIDLLKESLNE